MRFILHCASWAFLICNLLLAGSAVANGQIGGYHPRRCTAKNPAPDCSSFPLNISAPSPEYSEEARKAKIEGSCIVALIVDEKGNPTNIRVVKGLGMGLDEKAIEAVKTWKFEPAFSREGKPVAATIAVEVFFSL